MLIGAGLGEVAWSASPRVPRRWAWGLAAFMAALPDVDMLIGWVTGRGPVVHGTFTHSLSAVLLCTLLTVGMAGPRWGVLTFLGYGSHLLVDLLDSQRGPTNVTLGWPFSHASSTAIEPLFKSVPVVTDQGLVPAVESVLHRSPMVLLFEQTAVAAVIFAALLAVGYAVRRLRARWSAMPPFDFAAGDPGESVSA
jgi:membrane-bound metal-dependent hydrolase YbcI (DUF457 family)